MSESARLADQIRRAFDGEAWHGDSLMEILAGVNAKTAAAKPVPNAHSIWELLLHIAAWDGAAIRRAQGHAVQLSDAENFPPIETLAMPHGVVISRPSNRNTMNWLRPWHRFLNPVCRSKCPGKKRPTTTSITCSVESCSTSSTMPDKSHCSRNSSKV